MGKPRNGSLGLERRLPSDVDGNRRLSFIRRCARAVRCFTGKTREERIDGSRRDVGCVRPRSHRILVAVT